MASWARYNACLACPISAHDDVRQPGAPVVLTSTQAAPGRANVNALTTCRLVPWQSVMIIGWQGCALLERVDKVSKTPGLQEAQVLESLKKKAGTPVNMSGPSSPLQASPSELDFGRVPLPSERHATIVITNPAAFPLTVVQVVVEGDGFAVSSHPGDRYVIPAHGQLALTVAFKPTAPRAYSARRLLLVVDSAGGRLSRVRLTGRGT
jgi:hypothetical protein